MEAVGAVECGYLSGHAVDLGLWFSGSVDAGGVVGAEQYCGELRARIGSGVPFTCERFVWRTTDTNLYRDGNRLYRPGDGEGMDSGKYRNLGDAGRSDQDQRALIANG